VIKRTKTRQRSNESLSFIVDKYRAYVDKRGEHVCFLGK